jgi:hypothetical protein
MMGLSIHCFFVDLELDGLDPRGLCEIGDATDALQLLLSSAATDSASPDMGGTENGAVETPDFFSSEGEGTEVDKQMDVGENIKGDPRDAEAELLELPCCVWDTAPVGCVGENKVGLCKVKFAVAGLVATRWP